MPLTYTTNPPQILGSQRRVVGTITFDSSYVTGGEPFSPQSIGLTSLVDLRVEPGASAATNGFICRWNRSTTSPTVIALQGDNTNVAAAPAIEVPNTTNLAALVAQFEAVGY